MKNFLVQKIILALIVLNATGLFAQKPPEGIWQGYDGEWKHVTSQLVALAEATVQLRIWQKGAEHVNRIPSRTSRP